MRALTHSVPQEVATRVKFHWPPVGEAVPDGTRRPVAYLAASRRTRLRQDSHRRRVGPRARRIRPVLQNSPRRKNSPRGQRHNDPGKLRHSQRLPPLEHARVGVLQEKAHLAQRSDGLRLLQLRTPTSSEAPSSTPHGVTNSPPGSIHSSHGTTSPSASGSAQAPSASSPPRPSQSNSSENSPQEKTSR